MTQMPYLPPPRRSGFRFTRNTLLLGMAVLATGLNIPFWWEIQRALTSSFWLAVMMTIGCTILPPVLLSFLFPSNPAGALVAKFNAKLPGTFLIVGASAWFIFYGYSMQEAYWSAQPAGPQGHAWTQAILGMVIGYIVPTLAWGLVGASDIADELRQHQLVKKYKIEAEAQLAMIHSKVLRAQQLAAMDVAALTVEQRTELAWILPELNASIEKTLEQMGQDVYRIANAQATYTLQRNPEREYLLDYYRQALAGTIEDHDNARLP